jgi:hypothetical protein
MSMLPAGAFRDPLRREILEEIQNLFASGREVDALIVDWELVRTRAGLPGDDAAVIDGQPSYVTRLAAAAPATEKIAQTAYDLAQRQPHVAAAKPEAAVSAQRSNLVQPLPKAPVNGRVPGQRM